jgi:transposase
MDKILACDVSGKFLTPYTGELLCDAPNTTAGIAKLLREHPEHIIVCEPTSKLHQELVDTAYELGHEAYLVNPKEARNFKDSLSFRAKTDPLDARYLYEYVLRNKDLLRPYVPVSNELRELRRLLGERNQAVESRTALTMSFGKNLSAEHKAVLEAMDLLVKSLEKRMKEIATAYESYKRMRSIPGVGLVSACALVYVLESKEFDSASSLVAFLGLDVRIRLSGSWRGKSKLTKRGDPMLRFILCFAGRGLLLSKFGTKKREELTLKNRHFPERMIIAARKILRTAWHLFTTNQDFDPQKWTWA